MAATKEKPQTMNPAPEIAPGNVPALATGQKVGQHLSLYAGRVMPATFGEVIEFSQMMCKGGLSIPAHLRNNPGACLRVVQQSMAWEMDPWAVASKTYSVNDILAFEAQLVSAVIKRWAPIKEKVIPYKFTGEGGELQCSITVHHAETGEVIEYTSPKKKEITPQNSPLWKSDPQQQLSYYTIRALARRHFPEILLGVYDREEVMAMKDITPEKGVTNFLNDENAEEHQPEEPKEAAVEGEVLPPAEGQNDERKYKPGDEVTIVPPETQAANMLKYIGQETSAKALEEWGRLNRPDIGKLPDAIRKGVNEAYDLKLDELDF